MNRLHRALHLTITLALGLLMLGAATACKKQPFVQTVEQTLYLGLPVSIDGMVNIDNNRLRQVEGFNDFTAGFEANIKIKPVMDNLRTKVGFDPWKDINQTNIAFRGPQDAKNPEKNFILIVQGNFKNPTPKLDKLRDWLGDEYLADVKSRPGQHASGIPTYQITGKSQYDVKRSYELNFAFPTETLMVFSASAPFLNDALEIISGQAEGLQKDKTWMDTLKRPNISATIWGIGNVPAAMTSQLAASAPPDSADQLRGIKQGLFDINFSPDFVFHIGAVMDNIELATKLADKLRTGYQQILTLVPMFLPPQPPLPELTKTINNVKIMNELDTVNISLKVSADDQKLLSDEVTKLQESVKSGQVKLPIPIPGMTQGDMPGMIPGQKATPGAKAQKKKQ